MRKQVLPIIVMMLMASVASWAQTGGDGRKVKRITFDRERVDIEYVDGTKDVGVSDAKVKRAEEATGIAAVKQQQGQKARQWFIADGRPLSGEPQQKGVYFVRENNKVKKTVKK